MLKVSRGTAARFPRVLVNIQVGLGVDVLNLVDS